MTSDDIRGLPADHESMADQWSNLPQQCMFSGVRDIDVEDSDVDLGNGFSLVKPNAHLLSAQSADSMTGREITEGSTVSCYLVYKHSPPFPQRQQSEINSIFQTGLVSFQVIKPVRTLGILFYGLYSPGGFNLQQIERRPPMEPFPWARRRAFDQDLLKRVPETIETVQQIMKGPSAEKRNAFILLQLGLEHFHPLVSGLLWVMGLEAIFDSANRTDFKRKLSKCLGPSTRVFPDWGGRRPKCSVEEIATDLYTLRSKIAHGVDLRNRVRSEIPG